MSSTQFEGLKDALGIERGGGAEPCHGPPEAFTIVGLDKTAEQLLALYPETAGKIGEAHERARKLINGVRDRTRADDIEPPPEFVASIGAEGIVQRIVCANLGPDKKGKPWVLTVAGRKRNCGARRWNKAHPADAVEMLAEMRGFTNKSGLDAELAALDINSASNIFVAMRPSQMADHAAMHNEAKRPLGVIALKIGAKSPEHVTLLLALAKCEKCFQDAVDADKMALSLAPTYAALTPEEQVRRVGRVLAGKGNAAKNEAAPARAKTRPAPVLASIERTVRASIPDNIGQDRNPDVERMQAYADGLRVARGGDPPAWAKKFHEASEDERKAARKKGGRK